MTDSSSIRLAIAGDFCPTPSVEKLLLGGTRDAAWFLDASATVLKSCDLAIANLECVLAGTGTPIRKEGPCTRAHPDTIRLLTQAGIGLVTMANNHIRDFGDEGVLATIDCCREHGIGTVGAGVSPETARHILYQRVGGRQVALVNRAECEFAEVHRNRAGANPLHLIDLLDDIRTARSQADHVILILHGGLEYTHYPSPQSVKLLRFLAEQPVTAVIRHHPHFVQGSETWKGVPIVYSLGNFLYDSPEKSLRGWFEGCVVVLQITAEDSCEVQFHGFEQCLDEPRLCMCDGPRKEEFLSRMAGYSAVLKDPNALESEWNRTLRQRRDDYFGRLILPFTWMQRVLRRLGWLGLLRFPERTRLAYEAFLKSDAHREALNDIFEHIDRPR